MRQNIRFISQYIPWLLLLLGNNAFAALLLWIADIQAFYSMITVILLTTVLFFSLICGLLVHREQKRKQAFTSFLHDPEEHREELLKILCPAQRAPVRLLGRTLRDQQL